jgi:peptide chain release factor 1
VRIGARGCGVGARFRRPPMKDSMKTKLSQLARRLEEIDALLASQDTARDINTLRGLGQERAEIEPVVARFHDYNRARADELSAQEMLAEPEMKALAEEEIHAARARIESLEADLQRLLLPGRLDIWQSAIGAKA